jgi:hypothetical protein
MRIKNPPGVFIVNPISALTIPVVKSLAAFKYLETSALARKNMKGQASRIVFAFALDALRPTYKCSNPGVIRWIIWDTDPETLVFYESSQWNVSPELESLNFAWMKGNSRITTDNQRRHSRAMNSGIESHRDVSGDQRYWSSIPSADCEHRSRMKMPSVVCAHCRHSTPQGVCCVSVLSAEKEINISAHSHRLISALVAPALQ